MEPVNDAENPNQEETDALMLSKASILNPSYATRPDENNMVRSKLYLNFFFIFTSTGFLLMGISDAVFGDLYNYYITQLFGISSDSEQYDTYKTMFSVLHTGGATIGSFFASMISNRFGHRKSFIFFDFLTIGFCCVYQIPSLWLAFCARVFIGFVVGFNSCVVLSYISETIPVKFMGLYSGSCVLVIIVGVCINSLLNFGLSDDIGNWWRLMLGIQAICPIARLIYLFTTHHYESPRFLFMQHREAEAKEAIQRIYKDDWIEYELKILQIEKSRIIEVDSEEIQMMKKRRVRLICWAFFFNQFSGINVICFYTYDFFSPLVTDSNGDVDDTMCSVLILIYFVLEGIFAFIFSMSFDIIGRRPVVLFCIALTAFSLLGLTFLIDGELSPLATALLLYSFIIGFSGGGGSGVYTTSADIVVKEEANTGMFVHWVCALVTVGGYSLLVDYIGSHVLFGLFCVCTFGFFFFFYGWIKENKNKNELEIADLYTEKKDQ